MGTKSFGRVDRERRWCQGVIGTEFERVNEMQELNANEVEQVGGGVAWVPALYIVGAAAVTYKTAYETATFFGAGEVGSWVGGKLYDLMH